MGGQGSGRKPKTKTRLQVERELRTLGASSIYLIREFIAGTEFDNTGRPITKDRIDSAFKVIEHVKGKPGQALMVGPDEDNPMSVTINVISPDSKGQIQRVIDGVRTDERIDDQRYIGTGSESDSMD